ncbi:MAG TPA: beta-ketoacyl-[acyl-carrier-protein] synthase family protein [Verrucomicrobiae bacterium]|nr:beta-ketoacyl-[acyl-carrier-protein] synthase family protein [Verrucomicrobiae bacterium]
MKPSILKNLLRDNPVAVTGMGAFSSAGNSVETLWNAAVAGQGLAAWQEFDFENESLRFAVCTAPALDATSPQMHPVRKMDRCVQLAWVAAEQAWKQAQLEGAYPATRIGIIVASSRGPFSKRNESFKAVGRHKYPPSLSANSTFASLGGALGLALKIRGLGATVSATCASAAFAIGMAAEQILLGNCDAVLVGGTEAPLQSAILAQLHSAGVIGSHEEAQKTCRPFDLTRNGLVLGEGSGFLILESAAAATARKAKIFALLTGWGLSLDNAGRTSVSEDGAGLLQVMEHAMNLADATVEKIGYINAHGTGTKMNDAAEASAVKTLFGEHAAALPCSSTKPVTGHCLGATPALEAIIAIEAIRRGIAPPTANCVQLDPHCPINPLSTGSKATDISMAMSNSIGFWGYHGSLIFARA